MNLPFVDGIRRADRDNAIDLYIGEDYMDVLADGAWENIFKEKPEVFTREAKREWLDKLTDVSLGSDAFFPFGDNIERAHKSGVKYIAQPGGSVRDDNVIDTCNKYDMVMCVYRYSSVPSLDPLPEQPGSSHRFVLCHRSVARI